MVSATRRVRQGCLPPCHAALTARTREACPWGSSRWICGMTPPTSSRCSSPRSCEFERFLQWEATRGGCCHERRYQERSRRNQRTSLNAGGPVLAPSERSRAADRHRKSLGGIHQIGAAVEREQNEINRPGHNRQREAGGLTTGSGAAGGAGRRLLSDILGSPRRPAGCMASRSTQTRRAVPHVLDVGALSSELIPPGAIALHRTPPPPWSTATAAVKPC